jgi:uncharacterized protein YukE
MGQPLPTKQDLLREATLKETLASRMDRHAERLAAVFTGIPTNPTASSTYWKGPAAERYTAQAHRLMREINDLEQVCTTAARNLRRKAEQLRAAAAQSPDAW